MRRFFMIALILLTGLRGWAGDVMAMDMSRMAVSAPTAASSVASSSDAMPCHGEVSINAETDQVASECTACQVCHSPALQVTVPQVNATKPLAKYMGQAAFDWVSAELTNLQKPPVS
jgi:hypothetical protein